MISQPQAAVAIILAHQPIKSVLLLRRNHHPQDPWSGHFSFPGGRKDRKDGSLLDTCLRETYEESGILLSPDSLKSTLPPTIAGHRTKTAILVQPFLFHLSTRPAVTINNGEIQSSCWLDVLLFQQLDLHVEAEVLPQLFLPVFPLDDYYVWGFTYRLLQKILEEQAKDDLQTT
jgi:8-oxo-dGTP pyrophosphatase MutT (NUDIX family)